MFEIGLAALAGGQSRKHQPGHLIGGVQGKGLLCQLTGAGAITGDERQAGVDGNLVGGTECHDLSRLPWCVAGAWLATGSIWAS